MSAYALPGSFFFPSTAAATETNKPNEFKVGTNDETSSASSEATLESETQESWSNDLLISIKSASIDHIRLIQGFTARRPSISNSNRRSIRDRMASLSNSLTFSLSSSMTESDEHWGEYGYEEEYTEEESSNSPPISPRKSKVQFNFDEMDDASQRGSITDLPVCAASVTGDCAAFPVGDSSVHSNAHDDAIQFTLSISFNGRKYTATRALPSFVKLRNDLMLELANRKNNSVRFQSPSDEDIFYESKEAHGEAEDVVIPELPIGGDQTNDGKNAGLMGMAGRGFRGLQDTVKQFCPPMEDWIQSVATLVPSSPTLANFLWEPVQNNATSDNATAASPSSKIPLKGNRNHLPMRNSFRNSVQTLNSITESWGESENEDEVERLPIDQACLDDDGKEEFLA